MGKMVSATEFKAKCLALIDEMERSGEPLTVTRRGKSSLTLAAQRADKLEKPDIFGCMKGTFTIADDFDFDEPLDPNWEEEWGKKWDERGFPVLPDHPKS